MTPINIEDTPPPLTAPASLATSRHNQPTAAQAYKGLIDKLIALVPGHCKAEVRTIGTQLFKAYKAL